MADFILDSDHTKAVEGLHVARDDASDPTITLEPGDSRITVGRESTSGADTAGEIRVVNDDGANVANLTVDGQGAGAFQVRDGDATVRMGSDDGRGELDVIGEGGWTAVRADSVVGPTMHGSALSGGRVVVYNVDPPATEGTAPVVEARATAGGGELLVSAPDGTTTAALHAEDASLLLTGLPETGTGDVIVDDSALDQNTTLGGGELVIGAFAESPGDTPIDDVGKDIHVHARAERESDYGVDNGNRPRIFLDGPEATLDVGRGSQGENRPGVAGSVDIRDDEGETLLVLQTREDPPRNGEKTGEVEFRYNAGSGGSELRGRIRAHPRGLLVEGASGQAAILIEEGTGKVLTTEPIDEGGLNP